MPKTSLDRLSTATQYENILKELFFCSSWKLLQRFCNYITVALMWYDKKRKQNYLILILITSVEGTVCIAVT